MQTQQKKAVIYCRVSTKEQVEEGNSLVTQEKNCREYAAKNGYEILSVFIEQGESAKTADRTELKKLMAFCTAKKNKVTAVIAYKIDRISRNTDDYSLIRIQLKRYGVEIKSTSEYFEDTPAGRFMENIIANVAQFDNEVRTERSVGGMLDAVREGRYVWLAPYGYTNIRVEGKATIAPNSYADFVLEAFNEMAKNIYPAEEIRKKLSKEGMVNLKGNPISKSCFYHLLRNKIYTGWINQFGELNKGSFKAIISEELFNRVQWVLSGNSCKSKQHLKENPDFPLRKFFVHPEGQKLTGCWAKGRNKKYPYYFFHKHSLNFKRDNLNNYFKELLKSFEVDDLVFEMILKHVKKYLGNNNSDSNIEFEKLKKRAIDLKSKQMQLIDKNIEGVISNDLLREKLKEIDNEIYKVNQELSNGPKKSIDYRSLFKFTKHVIQNPGEAWENASLSNKIKLQWFYFPDGIVFDGQESRTNKICNLFKLKEHFLPVQSSMVTHPNTKSNTENTQITLPPKNELSFESIEFAQHLIEELECLNSLQSPSKRANIDQIG